MREWAESAAELPRGVVVGRHMLNACSSPSLLLPHQPMLLTVRCPRRSPRPCGSCGNRDCPMKTTSMFTTIEGDWDDVMPVIKRACDAVAQFSPRVSLVLKADLRPGFEGQLDAKVQRVEDRLND